MTSNHEAWERGYRAGHSNAMRQMSDEPGAPRSENPYPEFIPEDSSQAPQGWVTRLLGMQPRR